MPRFRKRQRVPERSALHIRERGSTQVPEWRRSPPEPSDGGNGDHARSRGQIKGPPILVTSGNESDAQGFQNAQGETSQDGSGILSPSPQDCCNESLQAQNGPRVITGEEDGCDKNSCNRSCARTHSKVSKDH